MAVKTERVGDLEVNVTNASGKYASGRSTTVEARPKHTIIMATKDHRGTYGVTRTLKSPVNEEPDVQNIYLGNRDHAVALRDALDELLKRTRG